MELVLLLSLAGIVIWLLQRRARAPQIKIVYVTTEVAHEPVEVIREQQEQSGCHSRLILAMSLVLLMLLALLILMALSTAQV